MCIAAYIKLNDSSKIMYFNHHLEYLVILNYMEQRIYVSKTNIISIIYIFSLKKNLEGKTMAMAQGTTTNYFLTVKSYFK